MTELPAIKDAVPSLPEPSPRASQRGLQTTIFGRPQQSYPNQPNQFFSDLMQNVAKTSLYFNDENNIHALSSTIREP